MNNPRNSSEGLGQLQRQTMLGGDVVVASVDDDNDIRLDAFNDISLLQLAVDSVQAGMKPIVRLPQVTLLT